MEANQYLAAYYERGKEDGRLASRHGSVEFLTTMHFIGEYLKPDSKIIEIGAGTGRYSHALARQGFAVDAVELVGCNIQVFKQNTLPGESVRVTQGNAMDLSAFKADSYDITLLLGPMYHLYTHEDKLRALSEAIRVTRPGGVIFAAYCISDVSILDYGFKQGRIFELIEKKMVDTETFKTYSNPWDIFELHRKEDIDALMEGFNTTRLHYVASDGYTNHMSEAVDSMDDATFVLYMKYHLSICRRPDMLGLTHHALDVFRKG